MENKLGHLQSILKGLSSCIIAYSGGVDSAFLLKVAFDTLGSNCLAVTAVSPSLAKSELSEAQKLASQIGAKHLLIQTQEILNPGYIANQGNRCYFCKSELYSKLSDLAKKEGFSFVADGFNKDDLSDYRPGMIAADEFNIVHPLLQADLTKAEIRELSKQFGLPVWDKPAAPCLSSRIPHGQVVTLQKLSQIEQAEAYLKSFGIRELRVRHHEGIARIEVPKKDFPILLNNSDSISSYFKQLGFKFVSLDLQGFRSGSLNEVLPK